MHQMPNFSESTRRPQRSIAWVYYTILAVVSLILAPWAPAILLFTALFAIYAVYIYRGGRFVLWIW